MSLLKTKTPPMREKRLQALQAYYGAPELLLDEFRQEVKPRVRTFSQTSVDDMISVLEVVSGIDKAVTIVHGPRGCAASLLYFASPDGVDHHWAVTDLDERDTIIGAEGGLREAIISLYRRHSPQLIFVVATPTVAINNDDILAVTEELKTELDVAIVPVFSDGFKSKIGSTGFDLVLHALLRYLPLNKGAKGQFINLISLTEDRHVVAELAQLVAALGLEVNILPRFGSYENIAKASQALASIAIQPDEADYLGEFLQAEYNVPFIAAEAPIGIAGTSAWLTALAKAVGAEQAAIKLIAAEAQALGSVVAASQLKGLAAYIHLAPSQAMAAFALVEELGGKIAGLTVDHIGQLQQSWLEKLTADNNGLTLHVAQGQPFEEVNILKRLQPDMYIGGLGQPVWAAKLGIAGFSPQAAGFFGYQGVRRFAQGLAKTLRNSAFARHLAKNVPLPYQTSWYQKSVNWYIKQEVK
jgi:nitrogenase molybdenum-iron protein alpha/beta subunit